MDMKKLVEILDKHIDQEALAKDIALEFLKQPLLNIKAKVESGELDLVKGTDLEKPVVIKVLDLIIGQI